MTNKDVFDRIRAATEQAKDYNAKREQEMAIFREKMQELLRKMRERAQK